MTSSQNRHRRRRRHHCSRTSSRLQNTVRVHLLGRGCGARYSPPTLRPTPKRTAPPLSNMDAGLPSKQNDHKQMAAASTNERHGGERRPRGGDARETIVTIELVSAQQGGACGVHRTHRDSGPGHSGFKRKKSSRVAPQQRPGCVSTRSTKKSGSATLKSAAADDHGHAQRSKAARNSGW